MKKTKETWSARNRCCDCSQGASVFIIALLSKYLSNTIIERISGALTGAAVFFIVTNFGVWFEGMYQTNFQGLMESYIMGLPFFGYSLISTFIFSTLIETIYKFRKSNFRILG